MRGSKRFISAAVVGAALLAGCAPGGSQEVTVFMSEGAWSVDPAVFGDVARLNFTFSNEGSEAHQPIAASAMVTIEEFEAYVEERGTANLVAELVAAGGAVGPGLGAALIYPDVESGSVGHFHPGDEDEPELPADAVVQIRDEGETISYLFTESIAPGAEGSGSALRGKVTFGAGTTFVVLCIDPDHAGRGEYVVFGISHLQNEL
ncbi:MAG: hypothetical protein ACE5KX_06195 [Acidimicrobiia bacterium]